MHTQVRSTAAPGFARQMAWQTAFSLPVFWVGLSGWDGPNTHLFQEIRAGPTTNTYQQVCTLCESFTQEPHTQYVSTRWQTFACTTVCSRSVQLKYGQSTSFSASSTTTLVPGMHVCWCVSVFSTQVSHQTLPLCSFHGVAGFPSLMMSRHHL